MSPFSLALPNPSTPPHRIDPGRLMVICRHFDRGRGGAERYAVRLAHAASDTRLPVTLVGQSATVDLQQRFPFVSIRPPRWSLNSKTPQFARLVNQMLDEQGAECSYAVTRVPHARVARVTDRVFGHWLQLPSSHTRNSPVRKLSQILVPRYRALLELERQFFESQATEHFIVQSHYERQLIQRYYEVPDAKLAVVYNGVNSQHYRPIALNRRRVLRSEFGYKPQELVLLFAASRHYDHKGLPPLLEALAQLDPTVQLLVVGGDRAGPWRRRVRRMRLESRVRFLPRQSDLRPLYGLADLFALPTLYEPCPNVSLEALACGRPVLTSATCGIGELVKESQEAGYVVEPLDVEAMVQAIRHFSSLPDDGRVRMNWEARQLAESLSWQRHFNQLWMYLHPRGDGAAGRQAA